MKRCSSILLAVLVSAACSNVAQPAQTHAAAPAARPAAAYDPAVPPTRKQVLRALFDSQDVSLAIDPSCSGVGTETTDKNIGDYISGFLAEQDSGKGKNWLQVEAKPAPALGEQPVWQCNVVIRHVDGDDRWGWGVSFLMKAKDHSVVKTSFRCTGSG